jgi:hypothetical protein
VREAYYQELLEDEHFVAVKAGAGIESETYTVPVDSADPFLVSETAQSIVRYLNLPLIQDTFESHAQRVSWFNDSGLLQKYGHDFYFENKLRLNKIQGPTLWVHNLLLSKSFRRRLSDDAFFDAIEKQLTEFETAFPDYGKGTVSENVAYVEAFETVLKNVLNTMIYHGLLLGEPV